MTVDVGDSANNGFSAPELRLGTGSTYGTNLLDATVVSNTTPNFEYQTWVSAFTVDSGDPIGDQIRIELHNPGGVQVIYDNVRLDFEAVLEPGSLALLGLGGLFLLRRRQG